MESPASIKMQDQSWGVICSGNEIVTSNLVSFTLLFFHLLDLLQQYFTAVGRLSKASSELKEQEQSLNSFKMQEKKKELADQEKKLKLIEQELGMSHVSFILQFIN